MIITFTLKVLPKKERQNFQEIQAKSMIIAEVIKLKIKFQMMLCFIGKFLLYPTLLTG